jgi:hypothetical protein
VSHHNNENTAFSFSFVHFPKIPVYVNAVCVSQSKKALFVVPKAPKAIPNQIASHTFFPSGNGISRAKSQISSDKINKTPASRYKWLSKQQDKYPFIACVQLNGLALVRADIISQYIRDARILGEINNKFAPHRRNIGRSRRRSEASCESGAPRGTQRPIETCKWDPSFTPVGDSIVVVVANPSVYMHNHRLHFGGEE